MTAFSKNVLKSDGRSPLYAFGTCGRLVWAVRPLAASVRLAVLEATEIQGRARSGASFTAGRLNCLYSRSLVLPGSLPLGSAHVRCSLTGSRTKRSLPFGRHKKGVAGRAERTRMQAQAVHTAPPNPSIERTRPASRVGPLMSNVRRRNPRSAAQDAARKHRSHGRCEATDGH